MAKSKYKQFKDGQEIEVEPGIGLNFACCDCALVHDLQVRLDGGKAFVSFARDNRRTAALRRRYITPMSAPNKSLKSDGSALQLLRRIREKVLTDLDYDADEIVREIDVVLADAEAAA